MIKDDTATVLVIRRMNGEDLLCLEQGERRGHLFRVNQTNPLAPSGGWLFCGIVQPWGFGYRAHYDLNAIAALDLDQITNWQRGDFWTYCNGKSRFTGLDVDHGTSRQWGMPSVRKLSRWPIASLVKDLEWRRMNAQRMNAPALDNTLAAIQHAVS